MAALPAWWAALSGLVVTVVERPELRGQTVIVRAEGWHQIGPRRVLPPPECPVCWSVMLLEPRTASWHCCGVEVRFDPGSGVEIGVPSDRVRSGLRSRFDAIEIDVRL